MSANKALVSVIIPTYNYAHLINKCLTSVINQTYKDLEIIVVDNHSEDSTEDVVKSLSDERVRYVKFRNNGSIAASRNYGSKISSGDLLAFLDSDDYWFPGKIEKQLVSHEASEDMISFHNMRLFGGRRIGRVKGYKLGSEPKIEMLTRGNPIITSTVMMSKSFFISAGGFPEESDFATAEDFALWLRLADMNASFRFIPLTLGGYRIHQNISNSEVGARATQKVVELYKDSLSHGNKELLKGWLDYSLGVRETELTKRRKLFVSAMLRATFRYRWRALVRLAASFFVPKFARNKNA